MLWSLNPYLVVFLNLFAVQTEGTDWLISGLGHLQGHVHDGGHSTCGGRPGGRAETLPRGASRLVNVDVTIHDAWHHHAVTHIQHLQSQQAFTTPSTHRSSDVLHQCTCSSPVTETHSQLTSQPTSSENLHEERIWCIFPSFITTTAGLTSLPTSTRLLLTALTWDPSSMAAFTES